MIKHQPSNPVTVIITRDQAVWRLDITSPLPTEPEIRKHAFVWLHDRMDELKLFPSARKECRRSLSSWLEAGRPHKGIRLVVCDEAVKTQVDAKKPWIDTMLEQCPPTVDGVFQKYLAKTAKNPTFPPYPKIPSLGKVIGFDPDTGEPRMELHGKPTVIKPMGMPVPCKPCGGTGKIAFGVQVGQYQLTGACALCGGSGTI